MTNSLYIEQIFSAQDLLSCASFGSSKCGGGRINYAFDFVISDGLVTESCMPYTSQVTIPPPLNLDC